MENVARLARLAEGDEEPVLGLLLPGREPNPVSEDSRLVAAAWRKTGSDRTRWKLKSRSAIVSELGLSSLVSEDDSFEHLHRVLF